MTQEQTKQMIIMLGKRIETVNLAFTDLIRDMESLLKSLTAKIGELEKENAELKGKKVPEK